MNLKINSTAFVTISEVSIPEIYFRRMKCGIEKVDALFGDGILPGSSITVTARAGLGKTTLVLQTMQGLVNNGYRVGYCSNEESVEQLAMTCGRLQVQNIQVCNESDVDVISSYMNDLDVIVIDSFQGLAKDDLRGRELEKYCIERLVKHAKETECAIILICHNTKAGQIKGSSLILHAVDVNMGIEQIKDAEVNARRIVLHKNRFGPAADVECYIQYSGYDFESAVTTDEDAAAPTSKSKKKQEQRDAIMLMDGKITIPAVCKAMKIDSSRAGFLLRELQLEGKLQKRGRGASAYWKLVKETLVEVHDNTDTIES